MRRNKAGANPSLLASFEALRLNAGVSDVAVSALLAASTWEAIEGDAERGRAVHVGNRPWHVRRAVGRCGVLA